MMKIVAWLTPTLSNIEELRTVGCRVDALQQPATVGDR